MRGSKIGAGRVAAGARQPAFPGQWSDWPALDLPPATALGPIGADDLGSRWKLWLCGSCCCDSPFSIIIMPPKKPAGNAVQAEVALQQSLKNCLVNLPSSLVSVLVNANTVRDMFHQHRARC